MNVGLTLLLFLVPAAAGADVAVLRDVRPIIESDYTRLVLDTSRRVSYAVRELPADPATGTPSRLCVDLYHTRPDPRLPLRLSPSGGPLVRLRGAMLDGDVTRLILDVPGLRRHTAFPLLDPFRLVVDVHGTPRSVAPSLAPARLVLAPAQPVPPGRTDRGAAVARRRLRIVLDPGHGGKDPGAIGAGGLREKDVVLALSLRLARRLRAAGHEVVLTRDGDAFLSLAERTARASAADADLFVSVHANASRRRGAAGIETYYLSNTNDRATIRLAGMENRLVHGSGAAPASDVSWILSDMIQSYKVEESSSLASIVQHELVGAARRDHPEVRDLGAKPGPFYVLVGSTVPAVLLEVGFLTHEAEGRRLARPTYQETIAEGFLRAIDRFVDNVDVAATL